MRRLSQDLPLLTQHFGNVAVHPLHAEESLPVIGSVPAPFVCERFHLHGLPANEWQVMNPAKAGL
jgi:hypothetical protein